MPVFGLPEGDSEGDEDARRVSGVTEIQAEVIAAAMREVGLNEVEIVSVSPKLSHVYWRSEDGRRRCVKTKDMAVLIIANHEARKNGGRAKL